jgi:Rps23 Pro-64 3,4-dihydroxylase Tpa1-like proline 4-hydroxylase
MLKLGKLLAKEDRSPSSLLAIDYDALNTLAATRAPAHAAAAPYAHSAIDDFLPRELAEAIAAEVPRPGGGHQWDRYFAEGYEDKWAISDDRALPDKLRELVREMNASHFLRFLEKLTGIEHLLPDPHLAGAGLHMVPTGGVLQVHSDFNYSKTLNAHRRVNVFLYLNPTWQDAWGGALELWDRHDGQAVASYPPRFNRLIVFNSRSDTFHGHPLPITAPKDQWRQSVAMYYYTSERPAEEISAPHNTIYKGLHV